MVNYREILRLSSDPKNSQRSIELMLHSSHHTIRKVQDAAKAAGISWPLEDDVTNEMLKEALFPEEGVCGDTLQSEQTTQYNQRNKLWRI